jgi:drug/metabolite transporter (DMT)-like permease
MAIFLALLAALCNALATILERLGVESAPQGQLTVRRLIAHVVRRPIWILGLLSMMGAFVFQAAALSRGGLSLVQPILVTELLFLVIILRVWFGRPLGWREAIGSMSTVAGLGLFLAISDQGGGSRLPSPTEWAIVTGVCAAGIGTSVSLARTGSRAWRSAWYGAAGGVSFAIGASFTKSATTLLHRGGVVFMLSHFEPYGIAVAGTLGLLLVQQSYHAGPITASQAALLIVDPIASIVIGVGLFGDNLRGGIATLALDALGLAVMSVGLFVLCHSPLIVSTTAEDRLTGRAPAGESLPSGAAGCPQ